MSVGQRRKEQLAKPVPPPGHKWGRMPVVIPHGDPPEVPALRITGWEVVVVCPWCHKRHRYNRWNIKSKHRFCDMLDRVDDVGFIVTGWE